jgi:hypothetical protein
MRPNTEPRLIESESPAFDASRFVVEVKSTAAKDGTQIDYYLLWPRNPVAGQPVPTLMTGYGAFGISLPRDTWTLLWAGAHSSSGWIEAVHLSCPRSAAEASEATRGTKQ